MPNVLVELYINPVGQIVLLSPEADDGLKPPPGYELKGLVTVRDDGSLGWEPADA